MATSEGTQAQILPIFRFTLRTSAGALSSLPFPAAFSVCFCPTGTPALMALPLDPRRGRARQTAIAERDRMPTRLGRVTQLLTEADSYPLN